MHFSLFFDIFFNYLKILINEILLENLHNAKYRAENYFKKYKQKSLKIKFNDFLLPKSSFLYIFYYFFEFCVV